MWLNSMQREEPYPGSNTVGQVLKGIFLRVDREVLHGCRQLVS